MKLSELQQIIKEEIRKVLKEAEAPIYTDWNEFTNPDYIMVHLKDGRKLQISKKKIAGGQRVYQAILQAFSDDRTDITNKIVGAMSSMLGGTLNKESIYNDAKSITESVITEGTTKTILGVKFKMAPASGNGIKFEFVDAKQFIKSGVSANEMVEQLQKMLDDKFGKDLFWFKSAGRMQYDTKVNGFEFRMNADQFFKDLKEEASVRKIVNGFEYFTKEQDFLAALNKLWGSKKSQWKMKTSSDDSITYSIGNVVIGSWEPNSSTMPAKLPPGAVNIKTGTTSSSLVYPKDSYKD